MIIYFYVSISQSAGIAVTVTRACVGVWDILVGRLISQLADSPLGAIVTHALITPNGKYVIIILFNYFRFGEFVEMCSFFGYFVVFF